MTTVIFKLVPDPKLNEKVDVVEGRWANKFHSEELLSLS